MTDIKKPMQYLCDYCQYKTRNKTDFERHLLTPKHFKNEDGYKKDTKNLQNTENIENKCDCGKVYKHHSGLWRHKKLCKKPLDDIKLKKKLKKKDEHFCIENKAENITDKDLIMYLLKENKEFKELIIEQSNKMMEQNSKMFQLANKPTISNISNTNNTNCNNNQQFNLQVFLNEKCKNAMNISDFVSSLEIESNDFEDMGKLGYVQGISNIFIKGLQDLDETIRPLHCSDIKREILYIKDNDTWNKDEKKQKIRNTIAMIAHKNFKYIPIWKEANPTASDVTTKKNTEYMRIVNQVTTGITPDDESGINKIIRNVANKVTINRSTDIIANIETI
jgi:hypothetical protein